MLARDEEGARQLNGSPIRVSTASQLDQSLLLTGFPYDRRQAQRFLFAVLRSLYATHTGGKTERVGPRWTCAMWRAVDPMPFGNGVSIRGILPQAR